MKKFNSKKVAASFKTRSFRVGGYSVAATLVFIAIVIVVNILANALPANWMEFDTTANQMFTMSQQTKEMIGGLEEDVTVYWLVRNGQEDVNVETLLSKYEDLSGKFKVVKKDPDLYPSFATNYVEQYNENSLIVTCGDRYRYVDYYEIFVLDEYSYYYNGVQEWSFSGEQALTSAVDYVVSMDLPKLYLLSGHGELTLSEAFAAAVENENIETEKLSLLSTGAVPEDADGVMIFSPQADLSDEEAKILKEYAAAGGKLLVFTDLLNGVRLTNLEAIMASYGVTLNEGMVVEANQSNYAMERPFCLLPNVGTHSIVAPLSENGYRVLLFPAQGLSVAKELPEGVYVSKLLTTSDSAYSKVAGVNITTHVKEEGDIDGPFALSVSIADSNTGAGIIWTTSSTLLNDNNNAMVSGGNEDLFLNMVNYLCEPEGGGISIRAKSLATEYLSMDSATSTAFSVLLIAILPLCYIAMGVVVWYRRKRK